MGGAGLPSKDGTKHVVLNVGAHNDNLPLGIVASIQQLCATLVHGIVVGGQCYPLPAIDICAANIVPVMVELPIGLHGALHKQVGLDEEEALQHDLAKGHQAVMHIHALGDGKVVLRADGILAGENVAAHSRVLIVCMSIIPCTTSKSLAVSKKPMKQ